jgi:hypothetical protein
MERARRLDRKEIGFTIFVLRLVDSLALCARGPSTGPKRGTSVREKREHHRAEYVVAVSVEAPGSHVVLVQSRDISQGGIFLVSDETLPIGAEVALTLDLPGCGSCKIPGYVRWLKSDGFGVQFGLLGARETHAIGKIVRTAQAS